jgi:hypothetical protein
MRGCGLRRMPAVQPCGARCGTLQCQGRMNPAVSATFVVSQTAWEIYLYKNLSVARDDLREARPRTHDDLGHDDLRN